MTPAQALLIKLMQAYSALDYSTTPLEVQKLSYFLQQSGEPLSLKFDAGPHGPYAAGLDGILEVMEGRYIRNWEDQQRAANEVELLPGAVEESTALLADKADSLARLNRVVQLIEGFETPYGMELLAATHWVHHSGGPAAAAPAMTVDEAVTQIHTWNPVRQKVFRPEHIRTAWSQLQQLGWISG